MHVKDAIKLKWNCNDKFPGDKSENKSEVAPLGLYDKDKVKVLFPTGPAWVRQLWPWSDVKGSKDLSPSAEMCWAQANALFSKWLSEVCFCLASAGKEELECTTSSQQLHSHLLVQAGHVNQLPCCENYLCFINQNATIHSNLNVPELYI